MSARHLSDHPGAVCRRTDCDRHIGAHSADVQLGSIAADELKTHGRGAIGVFFVLLLNSSS